jgi:SAM-dependent methyltransferase
VFEPNKTLDYRLSHLRTGQAYEAELGQSPLDMYLAAREAEIIRALVPRLFPQGLGRYLDFACGTGRITQLVEPLAHESFGIDVAPGMVELARERCPRTQFWLCDVTRQDPGIGPVQLVTAFRFFGNAQDELRRSALRALRRLLAPGGYLLVNNHRNPGCLRNVLLRLAGLPLPEYHGRPVDLHYWKLHRLLLEAGFRLVRAYGIGFWIFRAALERPSILQSRLARALESFSRLPPLGPFCPDAVLVARAAPG